MHCQPTPPAGGTLPSPPSPAIRGRRARGPLTACKQSYLPRPSGQGDAYCKNHPPDASPDLDRPPQATDIRQLTAPRLKTSHTRTRCVTHHDVIPPAASGPTPQPSAGTRRSCGSAAQPPRRWRAKSPIPNPGSLYPRLAAPPSARDAISVKAAIISLCECAGGLCSSCFWP
jgi:hypothetical protein